MRLLLAFAACHIHQMIDAAIRRRRQWTLFSCMLPRHDACFRCRRYINRYCQLERAGWSCSLCGAYNEHITAQEAK